MDAELEMAAVKVPSIREIAGTDCVTNVPKAATLTARERELTWLALLSEVLIHQQIAASSNTGEGLPEATVTRTYGTEG